jgi:hypothetical protein
MSDVSEECWSAAWLAGAEDAIPDLCRRAIATGSPQPWGLGTVERRTAIGLTYLAGLLGCWATRSDVTGDYVPYHPKPVASELPQPV